MPLGVVHTHCPVLCCAVNSNKWSPWNDRGVNFYCPASNCKFPVLSTVWCILHTHSYTLTHIAHALSVHPCIALNFPMAWMATAARNTHTTDGYDKLTLIIVNIVIAIHFQLNRAIESSPAFDANTFIFAIVQSALTMTWTSIFASSCVSLCVRSLVVVDGHRWCSEWNKKEVN